MNKSFGILIDNGDKDLSKYLEYFDESFESLESAMVALFKLSEGKGLIKRAIVTFGGDWMCSIHFDEKNCVKEISPPLHYFFALGQILPLLKKEWKHKTSADGVLIYRSPICQQNPTNKEIKAECECEEV